MNPQLTFVFVIAALLARSVPVWAAKLPSWAVGSWRGVAAVVDDSATQMGAQGPPAIVQMVQRTTLTVTAHSLVASPDGEVPLVEGQHVAATLTRMSAHHASPRTTHPLIVGASLTFDMTEPVESAVLAIRGCREPAILGFMEIPALKPRCKESYVILRFPDSSHIAVAASGGSELVIFERN